MNSTSYQSDTVTKCRKHSYQTRFIMIQLIFCMLNWTFSKQVDNIRATGHNIKRDLCDIDSSIGRLKWNIIAQ